jgi:transcriptional regulator of arginine metabolism
MINGVIPKQEDRKQLIADLIRSGTIHSQAELVKELEAKGMRVTQATASRDLQELGAMRTKTSDGLIKYILNESADPFSLSRLVISIFSSGNSVVLRTPPGAAQFLASTLDSAMNSGTLQTAIGTIAGDDTVLVIASTANGGKALAKKISTILGKEN